MLIYLKKRVVEDQNYGLNKRLESHTSKNNGLWKYNNIQRGWVGVEMFHCASLRMTCAMQLAQLAHAIFKNHAFSHRELCVTKKNF